MHDAIGVITNKPESNILGDLTKYRSLNTVPFGGKYKLIDFALSNMVNTGIGKIGVIGSHKYKSLVEHLGTGQEWSLSRKSKALSILNGGMSFYVNEHPRINLNDFLVNIEFFESVNKKNVVISGSDLISNISYLDAINFHKKKQADITMIYKAFDDNCGFDEYDTLLNIDHSDQKVIEICEYPNSDSNMLFIDMLIIKKDLLMTMIKSCDCLGVNWDLIEVIKNNISQLVTYAYPYEGYFCKVNSIKKYFQCSMDLLNNDIKDDLFLNENKIYTKASDNHPTKYMDSSHTTNALVASGCMLYGDVENSIIFRKVNVGEGAFIKNCVLMEKCHVGQKVILENVILDKDVTINDGIVLKGKENAPIVIGKSCCLG
ncbi:glucose-1-phosphate adenylyltransferase subunit GlgD [Vallitalea okinawensis]|uniref:glucose-1-phosphate adenylyltransferase subunit GlgD n=1 Tax=Vallitalea okinawensis TaxID=2078660 RepID=UPI000CFC6A65|nr:glucose-1-phosphate adenylyltransferase subunit GlgD [Vallitalea okinawensis]